MRPDSRSIAAAKSVALKPATRDRDDQPVASLAIAHEMSYFDIAITPALTQQSQPLTTHRRSAANKAFGDRKPLTTGCA
jgi:hypothetical protein